MNFLELRKSSNFFSQTNTLFFIVFVLTILAYLPSFPGGFVSDDIPLIKINPYLDKLSNISNYFIGSVWKNTGLELTDCLVYRPGQLIFYNLIEKIVGQNFPLGWRIVSMVLHLLNIFMFSLLARELCSSKATTLIIATGAALFSLWTFQLESIAWIAANVGLLNSLIVSMAVFLYLTSTFRLAFLFELSVIYGHLIFYDPSFPHVCSGNPG